MKESYKKIVLEIEHELDVIESNTEDILQKSEQCIKLLRAHLRKIKK